MVEEKTTDLFERIKGNLGKDANISDIKYEGCEIVLYTKNKEFFVSDSASIKDLVSSLKKRIILRPDPSICIDMEKAEKKIKDIIPEEAGLKNIDFEPEFSKVIIEADKPGLVIGKGGETLKEIKKQTLWFPIITRAPAIPSDVVKTLREIVHRDSEFRKDFLDKVGKRIHGGWKPTEWIRLTALGGFREVGRSALLLQTPESRILLDCGIKPGTNEFPYLNVPEFDIHSLNAIVLSHAHLDHCALVPYLYEMGFDGPLYCTVPSRDLMVLLCMDYIEIMQREGKTVPYSSKGIKEAVKHSVCLDYDEVSDITPDVRLTLFNAGHILGSSIVHLHVANGLHNILYSLDWNSPVTVFDSENNVHIIEIGKLIDNIFKDNDHLISKNGIIEILPNLNGWKAIVFDPKTYEQKVVEITNFVRHQINDNIYEIKTETGKTVRVTGSHSVFKAKGGIIKESKVSELHDGDWIIGLKNIKIKNKPAIINLREYSNKFRFFVEDKDEILDILKLFDSKLKSIENKDEIKNWIKDHFSGLYKKDIKNKYHVHMRRINRAFKLLNIKNHPRVGHPLPSKLHIDKDFARFLGYYISEGSINENTICITNHSKDILNDCKNIIKNKFGSGCDVRYKDNAVLIHSKQIKMLIKDVLKCGTNAYEKRVPPVLLTAPEDVITEFLKGYFLGDGGHKINEKSKEFNASSKSKFLIQDIGFLLLTLNITPTFTYNKCTDMYEVHIYGLTNLHNFLNKVNINKWRKILEKYPVINKKSNYSERIPITCLSESTQKILSRTAYKNAVCCGNTFLEDIFSNDESFEVDKKLLNSCFTFERIKSITKVKPSKKFVYDLQIDNFENFVGGEGFLFLHNTGDLKFDRTALYEPASLNFQRAETVVIESTYGSSEDVQPKRQEAESQLLEICKKTTERGGIVLIPSFAVERSQDLMVILARSGFEYPVYLDGMVWDATAIHTTYPEFLNRDLQKLILQQGFNPFTADIFKRIGSQDERKAVLESKEPCVVIATSGMLIGGPSVSWLQNLAEGKKNSLLFVGWQSEGTLGRRIQKGWKEIPMEQNGKTIAVPVNLEVETISGLSGHSDVKQLMNYLSRLKQAPERVIVNHGENNKCVEFSRNIYKVLRCETLAPKLLETVRLK